MQTVHSNAKVRPENTKSKEIEALSIEPGLSIEDNSQPLSMQTSANATELHQDPFLTPDYLRLKSQRMTSQNQTRSEPEPSEPVVLNSTEHGLTECEEHPWPPIQPIKMNEQTKREFLAGLEALDCRDVQTQAQKRIGLLLIGGYTEEEVEEMCKPKPIPIDKIHREIMELQERALKRYERERRREERERQLYN